MAGLKHLNADAAYQFDTSNADEVNRDNREKEVPLSSDLTLRGQKCGTVAASCFFVTAVKGPKVIGNDVRDCDKIMSVGNPPGTKCDNNEMPLHAKEWQGIHTNV